MSQLVEYLTPPPAASDLAFTVEFLPAPEPLLPFESLDKLDNFVPFGRLK